MGTNTLPSTARRSASVPAAAMALFVMAGEWVLMVAGTRKHEMVVGVVVVLASGLFLRTVHKSATLRLTLEWRDLRACWRVPWYIISGSYEIIKLLLRDALTSRRAESLYRVSGFATAKDDPRMAARRVLATAYTTAAPNFIVIGIDCAQSRMLFHQIERSSVPKMTRELGAQS